MARHKAVVKPGLRWWWIGYAVFALGLLIVGGATGVCAMATVGWPFELATHFRVYYVMGAGVCVVGLLVGRAWRTAGLGLLVMLVNLATLGPIRPWGTDDQPGEVTLLMANVFTANTQHERLLQLIDEQAPHLIALMEVNDRWTDAMRELHAAYPHRIVHPRSDNFGIALYSRLAIDDLRIVQLGSDQLPSVTGNIAWPGTDQRVHLVFTHPLPPVARSTSQSRNEQLQQIARYITTLDSPVILAGDLNITPWSPVYADLIVATGLTQPRRGRGLLGTWPARLPAPLRLPIDHVLLSHQLSATRFTVGLDIGSDHLPVVTELKWNR